MEEGYQEVQEEEEEGEQEEEFEETDEFSPHREQRKKKPCNQRIEELSTPNKRMFLALWNEHAYHLPKDKVKHLKHLLQQLYALSPEETAKYFAELRAAAKAAAMRRKLKQKLRKYLLDKHHQKQRQRAYKLFKRLLKCGISYAAQNPVPPLVSVRLRYLSDIILEQLCDLRKLDIPDRLNPDTLGNFLISVSDWMAIAVERLYYAAQLSINELTEHVQAQEGDQTMEVPKTYEEFSPPLASSTPQRLSLDETVKAPKTYTEMGQPVSSSTPRRLSMNDETIQAPSSTPQKLSLLDQTPAASKAYGDMGQPTKGSTLDQTAEDMSRLPFYSFIETESQKSKRKTNIAPYNLKNIKAPPGVLDKSHLEIPLYGFERMSKNVPKRVIAENLNNILADKKHKHKNKHHLSTSRGAK